MDLKTDDAKAWYIKVNVHAMKTYRARSGIAPLIRNFGTR